MDWFFLTFTPEKKSLSIEDDNPELPGKKQLKWLSVPSKILLIRFFNFIAFNLSMGIRLKLKY